MIRAKTEIEESRRIELLSLAYKIELDTKVLIRKILYTIVYLD